VRGSLRDRQEGPTAQQGDSGPVQASLDASGVASDAFWRLRSIEMSSRRCNASESILLAAESRSHFWRSGQASHMRLADVDADANVDQASRSHGGDHRSAWWTLESLSLGCWRCTKPAPSTVADRQREPGTGTSGEESTDPLAVVQMPSSCVIIDLAMSSMLRNLAFESRWMRRMFSTSALICSTAATAAP